MTHRASPTALRWGLRENLPQFLLLVAVNALVGATLGQERTVLPLLATEEFGLDRYSGALTYILAFGLAWLLPVFLVGLVAIGILSGRTLLKSWRVAILLIFIASAIITPTPDPFTMFLLAGPLCVLYFAAVGIALLIDRRRVQSGQEPDWSHLSDDEASPLT